MCRLSAGWAARSRSAALLRLPEFGYGAEGPQLFEIHRVPKYSFASIICRFGKPVQLDQCSHDMRVNGAAGRDGPRAMLLVMDIRSTPGIPVHDLALRHPVRNPHRAAAARGNRAARCQARGRASPPAIRCLPPTWRPTGSRWKPRRGCRARTCRSCVYDDGEGLVPAGGGSPEGPGLQQRPPARRRAAGLEVRPATNCSRTSIPTPRRLANWSSIAATRLRSPPRKSAP